MKMNYFSFLRIPPEAYIRAKKNLNMTQALFEIINSGLPIFWIYCHINLGVNGVQMQLRP